MDRGLVRTQDSWMASSFRRTWFPICSEGKPGVTPAEPTMHRDRSLKSTDDTKRREELGGWRIEEDRRRGG